MPDQRQLREWAWALRPSFTTITCVVLIITAIWYAGGPEPPVALGMLILLLGVVGVIRSAIRIKQVLAEMEG